MSENRTEEKTSTDNIEPIPLSDESVYCPEDFFIDKLGLSDREEITAEHVETFINKIENGEYYRGGKPITLIKWIDNFRLNITGLFIDNKTKEPIFYREEEKTLYEEIKACYEAIDTDYKTSTWEEFRIRLQESNFSKQDTTMLAHLYIDRYRNGYPRWSDQEGAVYLN